MPSLSGRSVLPLPVIAVLALAGCTAPARVGKSPLAPARMSPDSCVLEVFFCRFPFGDPEVNERLWQQVDEQHFPADLRRRLGRNGFRVGLLGGHVPDTLAKLLQLTAEPEPAEEPNQVDLTKLASGSPPVRRHLPIRAGQRKEIVASGVYDRLPVLLSESAGLGGQSYSQAQAVLALRTFPQGDGRVRVELVPELHHGQPRQHFVGRQGMWRLEVGRPRRAFDQMAFSATLAPGHMLLVTSLPDRPGSLGHHFFTQGAGQLEQKLLVLRLSQTQHGDLFRPPGTLGLEE